jgi:hypothetical protein
MNLHVDRAYDGQYLHDQKKIKFDLSFGWWHERTGIGWCIATARIHWRVRSSSSAAKNEERKTLNDLQNNITGYAILQSLKIKKEKKETSLVLLLKESSLWHLIGRWITKRLQRPWKARTSINFRLMALIKIWKLFRFYPQQPVSIDISTYCRFYPTPGLGLIVLIIFSPLSDYLSWSWRPEKTSMNN